MGHVESTLRMEELGSSSLSEESLSEPVVDESKKTARVSSCDKICTIVAMVLGILIAAGGAVILALLCICSPILLSCSGIVLVALGAVVLGAGIANACKCCLQRKEIQSYKNLLLEKDEMIDKYARMCDDRGRWILLSKAANEALLEEAKKLLEKVKRHREVCSLINKAPSLGSLDFLDSCGEEGPVSYRNVWGMLV